ncbi:amidohydrolase [Streptomyces collinus]|uniref:amidohydrolase n=1 Tax=Streptomyces collinus TaxID=42684 RepID=UPI00342AF81F
MDSSTLSTLIQIRRRIHANPEIARQEFGTTELVADTLRGLGLEPRVFPSGTGVFCDIGTGSGPVVALRADIDALPVTDEKSVPYRSTKPGFCHACGHDVHTTIMLGVGMELAPHAEELDGRVRLVFQPAEESVPSGSLDAIDAGVLKDVSAIYTLHCDPAGDVGSVGIRVGPITSSLTTFDVRLTHSDSGRARRADLIAVMSQLIVQMPRALQDALPPGRGMISSVVFSAVNGDLETGDGSALVTARGTIRSLSRDAWAEAPGHFARIADAIAGAYEVTCVTDFTQVAPAVTNDPQAMAVMSQAVTDVLGSGAIYPTPQSLGGEDFAWYLEHVPGGLLRLGVRSRGQISAPDLHSGAFDVDEECIPVGVSVMKATALAALRACVPALETATVAPDVTATVAPPNVLAGA